MTKAEKKAQTEQTRGAIASILLGCAESACLAKTERTRKKHVQHFAAVAAHNPEITASLLYSLWHAEAVRAVKVDLEGRGFTVWTQADKNAPSNV